MTALAWWVDGMLAWWVGLPIGAFVWGIVICWRVYR